MLVLLLLILSLCAAQHVCARQTRQMKDHLMRPAQDWEDDDVDQWLNLIEPFPLPDRPSESRS